jgi:hypothetical protein
MIRFPIPSGAIWTRMMTIILALALVFGFDELRQLPGAASAPMAMPEYWIGLLAPGFYLWALWSVSAVFVRLDSGEDFGPAVVSGWRAIGTGLMLGSVAAIIIQPSLSGLFVNNFSSMVGVKFNLDIEYVTLGLVGLVLVMLARRGATLQAQLDEFV